MASEAALDCSAPGSYVLVGYTEFLTHSLGDTTTSLPQRLELEVPLKLQLVSFTHCRFTLQYEACSEAHLVFGTNCLNPQPSSALADAAL